MLNPQVTAEPAKPRVPWGLCHNGLWDTGWRGQAAFYYLKSDGTWQATPGALDPNLFKWQQPPQAVWLKGLHNSISGYHRGTDPEFFLWDGQRRIPAFEALPDKHHTNSWFWDGFQAEVTVKEELCHQCLVRNISQRMKQLKELGLKVHPSTVWRIPEGLMQTASDSHVALGCDASYNAYHLRGREVPDARLLPIRSCGGHLHFAMPKSEQDDWQHVVHIVKTLDLFLGVPSVALFQNVDQRVRRLYYGLPGEFRTPPHGLEYRVLSNAWAWHPLSTMLVFDLARHAFGMGRAHYKNLWRGQERQAVECIQYGDVRASKELTKQNKWYFEEFCGFRYARSDTFWKAIEVGVDKVIPNFGKDIVEQWQGIEHYRQAPSWRHLNLDGTSPKLSNRGFGLPTPDSTGGLTVT